MLYCCLDGKHVKYAWNSWPRGGELVKWNVFFLPAKRDHLHSASPLILIKDFLGLRCFSKRIEGHILILFLRESWNDNVLFVFSGLLQSWEKKQEQSRKILPVSAPCAQGWCQAVLWTLHFLPCYWSSAPGMSQGEQPILLALELPQNMEIQDFSRKEPHGGLCNFPLHLQRWKFARIAVQPLLSQLLYISWPVPKVAVKDPSQASLTKLACSLKLFMFFHPDVPFGVPVSSTVWK